MRMRSKRSRQPGANLTNSTDNRRVDSVRESKNSDTYLINQNQQPADRARNPKNFILKNKRRFDSSKPHQYGPRLKDLNPLGPLNSDLDIVQHDEGALVPHKMDQRSNAKEHQGKSSIQAARNQSSAEDAPRHSKLSSSLASDRVYENNLVKKSNKESILNRINSKRAIS